jgi:hypothetical protein
MPRYDQFKARTYVTTKIAGSSDGIRVLGGRPDIYAYAQIARRRDPRLLRIREYNWSLGIVSVVVLKQGSGLEASVAPQVKPANADSREDALSVMHLICSHCHTGT